MPDYQGRLAISIEGPNPESFLASVCIEMMVSKANIAPDADMPNGHNIALDKVSFAIARAMGLCWAGVARVCGHTENGMCLDFTPGEGGEILTLPETHPAISGEDSQTGVFFNRESIVHIGNGSAVVLVDRDVVWETAREWPDDSKTYRDSGMLAFFNAFPEAATQAYDRRAKEGGLMLDEIVDIPALAHFKIPVTGMRNANNVTSIHLDVTAAIAA